VTLSRPENRNGLLGRSSTDHSSVESNGKLQCEGPWNEDVCWKQRRAGHEKEGEQAFLKRVIELAEGRGKSTGKIGLTLSFDLPGMANEIRCLKLEQLLPSACYPESIFGCLGGSWRGSHCGHLTNAISLFSSASYHHRPLTLKVLETKQPSLLRHFSCHWLKAFQLLTVPSSPSFLSNRSQP